MVPLREFFGLVSSPFGDVAFFFFMCLGDCCFVRMGSNFWVCASRFAVTQCLLFLFQASLQVALVERGLQRMVQHCHVYADALSLATISDYCHRTSGKVVKHSVRVKALAARRERQKGKQRKSPFPETTFEKNLCQMRRRAARLLTKL